MYGYRVSVGNDEKVLEMDRMDSGNGCPTLLMYLMPLNYPLKNVKMVNFLPQLKKKFTLNYNLCL